MKARGFCLPLLLAGLAGVAACETADQPHPFERVGPTVSRTVPAGGGFISTPAGAAVYIAPRPAGSLELTLGPVADPPQLSASGRRAGGAAFLLAPAGLPLPAGSRAELLLDRAAGDSLWLATAVQWGPGGVEEHGRTRVNLTLGIAEAEITTTGLLAAVIPPAGAVIPLSGQIPPPPPSRPLTAAEIAYLLTIDSLTVNCGPVGNRCTGLVVAATENLLGQVRRAALVLPRLSGVLRREGTDVVGSVSVEAAFRVELGGTADNIGLSARFPVHTSLLTTVFSGELPRAPLFQVTHGVAAQAADGESITVYPPRDGQPARAVIERTVQVSSAAGVLEPARIHISFPFQVHHR